MIESDIIILKKIFILKDYVRKIFNESDDYDRYVDEMSNKVCELKSKLSFNYRRRDEIPLRYLASKL
jgi:hypothetical protein|tara:strand:+ start:2247 stop:2447 length:201 start_codon:yes stop_codon:yes gene_type:complete